MHRYSLKHSLNTLNDEFNIFNNFECTILQLSISRNKTVSGHAQCNRVLTHQQKKQKRWNVPSSPTFFNPTLVLKLFDLPPIGDENQDKENLCTSYSS